MDRTLITNGSIISMDAEIGDFRRADLLIEDGRIVAVAPSLEVGDSKVINADRMVVLPGLVDSHRHLWYAPLRGSTMDHTIPSMATSLWAAVGTRFEPEDLYAATRAGIADALENGITTVLDFCHVLNSPDHASEAVRAHLELPMRGIFAYGASIGRKLAELDGDTLTADEWAPARTLREGTLSSDNARVTMALAPQGPETSTPEQAAHDVHVARELGLPITMHVGTPADPRTDARAVGVLADLGLLGPDMNFVHCCATSDAELDQLAAAGATVTVSPMAELALGMGYPPTGRLRSRGIIAAVGADAVCASTGDLFDEARHALIAERARGAEKVFADGRAPVDAAELGMSARSALEMITIDAARACWLGDLIGSLSPGKAADVILLRASDLSLSPMDSLIGSIVGSAHGANVDTVIVGGKLVKHRGRLLDVDTGVIEAALVASHERLVLAPAEESTEARGPSRSGRA